ncbi:substrate-binding domain-containing protein [Microbacterium sp. ARD31]|uniref:sugar ABC transporter substrate-binding protein n=1 Tax=Microbacterium sp. ARD31 TaxID=2962576 RepID=UPI0028817DFC|nr:substrate-binding domain-containing protein [Microbacterium sp. ARD31]MDT0183993.1 substrate-binding domain-containing protein [Microbacterium sp. ARD31]
MKHRYMTVAAIAAVAALGLSGCTAGGTGGATGEGDENKGPLAMIGLYNAPYPNNMAEGARDAADAEGVEFTQYGPQGLDPNKAITDFQNAIAAGAKGVLVHAYPGDLWRAPIDRAVDQGIVVATADVYSEGSKAVTEVGAPKVAMGAGLADLYIEQLPADAEGVIIPGICVAGLEVLIAPLNGFRERIEAELPGVTVPEPEVTAGDPAGNFAAWQRIIAKYPDALGFVGACDVDVPNLIKVKESSGDSYLIGATAGGDDPGAVEAIGGGLMVGAVTQRSWLQGYVGTKLIANSAFRGDPMPVGWVNTGYDIVTAENLEEIVTILQDPDAAKDAYQALGDEIVADVENLVHSDVTYQYDLSSVDETNPQP